MPVIAMFYGIVVMMFYMDNKEHHLPHIHVRCGGEKAVFEISSGKLMAGNIPPNKRKLVEAWIEIHRNELMEDWDLTMKGAKPKKIKPLI